MCGKKTKILANTLSLPRISVPWIIFCAQAQAARLYGTVELRLTPAFTGIASARIVLARVIFRRLLQVQKG
jgi:hypothetical protein